MSPVAITLLVIVIVLAIIIAVLYFLGKKAQKKQAEQQELKKQYSSHTTMARLCPYCQNKLEVLCKGTHGASYVKCSQCGEQVFFPPVTFRISKSFRI